MESLKLYKIKDVAKILDISTRTVQKYITEGTLPAKKIGGSWRIDEKDLKEYLAKK